MRLFKRFFLFLLLICVSQTIFSQLQIVPQTNAQTLAQKLVGSGVIINNVKLTGSRLSTAFFYNQGGTRLGIDSGIVLSTGRVLSENGFIGLNGPQSALGSNQIGTDGNDELDKLVYPSETGDAVVLEFDFTPIGDSVKFRYVFSSEEYPTFTCSNFNDVFAFFISGPGINGSQNIALVPGTTIPVAINSINSSSPGDSYNIGTCNSMGPGSPFIQYYVDNTDNNYFTHNGHTTVLTASSAVQPCQTYHLKIAIADVQDRSYDSGVFLEAESLRSEPLQIVSSLPLSAAGPYLAEGCHKGGINILRAHKAPNPVSVNLSFGGTAINGVDVQTIPSTVTIAANDSVVFVPIIPIADTITEGSEVFKIYISNSCLQTNNFLDSLQIQIRDYDTLAFSPAPRVGLCSNNAVQLIATDGYASYQWTPAQSLSNATINDPQARPLESTTYVCTATLGSCLAKDSVRVQLKKLQLLSKKDINCTNSMGEIKVSGGWEWKQPVLYSIDNKPFGTDSTFTTLPVANYIIRIKDAVGCMDSLVIAVEHKFTDLTLQDSVTAASCMGSNGSISLKATGGTAPYQFSLDAHPFDTAHAYIVNGGAHSVSVQDGYGCVETHKLKVGSDPPINFSWITDSSACDGSSQSRIHIQARGGDNSYEYSIDGVHFQSSDSFLVNSGSLSLVVRDSKGCAESKNILLPLSEKIFVNAGNDTAICEGTSIHFHTIANASSFVWTPAATLSDASLADPVVSPATSTTYFITATKGICTAHDTVTVTVWPAPVPDAGPDSTICLGKSLRLQGSGGENYSWSPHSQLSDPSLPNPLIKPVQSTQYRLKVYDAHHCASLQEDTVIITTVSTVKVFAGRDTTIALYQPLQLQGQDQSNSGAILFQWLPAYGLSHSDILNPTAILDKDITYRLKLTTAEGCEGSDEISIRVFNSPDIFVPTGFTPNGDGRNDILKPIPVGMKALTHFTVFNRWGQLVFSTTTESRGWDGTVKGRNEPTGTYIWVAEAVDYKGNLVQRRGSVTLLR